MDFRAVIVCLCLLIARSHCAPTGAATQKTPEKTQREKDALQGIHEAINRTLDYLAADVPNDSRASLNKTEELTVQDYIPCLLKLSDKLPMLQNNLTDIAQGVMDFANLTTYPKNCSLPLSGHITETLMQTKSLLEHLQKTLEKTKF